MSARSRSSTSVTLGLVVLSLALFLGANPCVPEYELSRTCTDLSMVVRIGQPAVPVPDCLGTSAMEFTLLDEISFPSVPPTLTETIVPTRYGSEILVSPSQLATPGEFTIKLHTSSRNGGQQPPHNYSIKVSIFAAPLPDDFAVRATSPSLSIVQGKNGTDTILTGVSSGIPGTVNLTANVSPPGPTVSLDTASVTAGDRATLTVSVGASVATGSYVVTVTGVEGSFTHSTTMSLAVLDPDDFSVSATPASLGVVQGGTGISSIYVSSDIAGPVNLTTSVSPPGPTASLGTPSANPLGGFFTPLTVSVGESVATSTYAVTVTCAEGSFTHSTTVNVEVTATDDFAVSADGNNLSILQRSSGVSTISTAVATGSPGTISLAASVSPPGPIASLNPASVAPGDNSVLTVSVDSSVAPGSYIVTVNGAAGSATHSTTVGVDVLPESPAAVTVDAASDVIPGNASVELGCHANHGIGPFDYSWHGYRNDGAPDPGPFALSSTTVQFPAAQLFFPTTDFYFFCVVTDNGVDPSSSDRTATGYVRVSESDGPVGRFTVVGGPFHLGDDVSFDASGTTDATTPVTWSIEQYIGTQTPDGSIEGFLRLFSTREVVWVEVFTTDSVPLTVTIPAAAFPAAGIYRMRLDVFDDAFDAHTSYQYFTILP